MGFFDFGSWHGVKQPFVDRKDARRLFPNAERAVLRLFEQFGQTLATFDLLLCSFVEVTAELGKARQLAELAEAELKAA